MTKIAVLLESTGGDEEVSLEKSLELFEIYKKVKPAIMITHDIPRDISKAVFGLTEERAIKNENLTNLMLNDMWMEHKPKLWVHGHWHSDYQAMIDVCLFVGLGINSWNEVEL